MADATQEPGIVVLPPFSDLSNKTMNLSFAEADARLLYYLTYFHTVSIAALNPNFGHTAILTSTELEQTLVHGGSVRLLNYGGIQQGGDFDPTLMADLSQIAYQSMNNGERGLWAIAPPEGADATLKQKDLNSVVVKLEKCLPCPREDVPAVEIVSFRAEHAEELDRFKHGLKRTFLTLGAGSVDGAEAVFKREVLDALSEVQASFKKRGIPFALPGMEVSIQIPGETIVLAAEAIGTMFGAPHGWGGAAGAFVSASLGGFSLPVGGNRYPKDYKYVATGLRRGLLEAFSDRTYQNDIEGVFISKNLFQTSYPTEIRPPSRVKGGVYELNANML